MTQEFLEKIIEAHNVCCPICGQNEEALFSCADTTHRPFANSEKSKVEVSITYGKKE